MNAKHQARRLGVGVAASVLVAVMAASAVGCGFLKPKTKKAFAETCAVDSDCDSLDCAGQGNVCSKACQYNADCGGTLVCRQKDDGSGDHCTQPVGVKLNGSCMDPSDCENGHCLKHVGEDNAPGICSRFCAAPADCPDGMKICDTISDTGVLKMCLPGGAPGVPVAKFGTVPRSTVAKPVVTVPPPVATVPPAVGNTPGPTLGSRTAATTPTVVPPAATTAPPAATVAKPAATGVKLRPRH
jgi:hypothetical protein